MRAHRWLGLVTSRWIRIGLLVTFLAFCGYGLYLEWPQATAALARLHWYTVALSLAAALAGAWCMMLAWRAILADLGSPLPIGAAAKICFVAQLGKYVPGAVWAFAAQVELGHDLQVPRRRGIASVAVSLAITAGAGLCVAAVTMPLASPHTARHYWWLLIAVPVLAIGLCPPVLGRLIDRALTVARWQPLERRPTWDGLVRALGWTLLGWLFLGAQVWLPLSDITGRGVHVLPLAVGAYALAFSAGLLLVVFPSGIGIREVILIAALAPVAPRGTAVAIAVAARVVTTASDLAWGSLGLAMGRGARTATPVPAPSPVPGNPGQILLGQVTMNDNSAFRADLARSARLVRAFRTEQVSPAGYYTLLASDTVGQLSQYADLEGRVVADIGGGPGFFVRELRRAGARSFCVDTDTGEMAALGRPESGSIAGSALLLPLATGAVDVCFSSNVVEHVGEWRTMLAEMVRVTRPGGVIFVAFTNWLSPWGGHETSPWHYLGGERAAARYQRKYGKPPKNRYRSSLHPVSVADALAWARSADGAVLIDAVPRYLPGWTRPLLRVPVLREFGTWNLLLVLRRAG